MCHAPERYTAYGTDDRKKTRRYRNSTTMRYRKSKLTCFFIVSITNVRPVHYAPNIVISYNMRK